jgi:hypothetical protein
MTGTSRAAARSTPGRHQPAQAPAATAAFPAQAAADRGSWAGRGFTRPGPGAEVPTDLFRAALEDALAYTTDHDGCTDCDRGALCEAHAARAGRARQYQQALDRELEAGA